MNNTIKWFGIIAFTAAIFISCNTTKVSIHDIPREYIGKEYVLSYGIPDYVFYEVQKSVLQSKDLNAVMSFRRGDPRYLGSGCLLDVELELDGESFYFKSVGFENGEAVINWNSQSRTENRRVTASNRVSAGNIEGKWYSSQANASYTFNGNNFVWSRSVGNSLGLIGYTGLKGTFESTQSQILFIVTHAEYSSPRDSHWMPISEVDPRNLSLLGEPYQNKVVSYNFSTISTTNITGSKTFAQININGMYYLKQ